MNKATREREERETKGNNVMHKGAKWGLEYWKMLAKDRKNCLKFVY